MKRRPKNCFLICVSYWLQLLAEKGRCTEARPINAGKRGAMAMQEAQRALQLCPLEAQ